MTSTSALLETIDPDDTADAYHRLGLDRRSDHDLVEAVAIGLGRPKVAPAGSFVLHAPLELLARAHLLDLVPAEDREPARVELARLATRYRAAGDELADPAPIGGTVPELAARLEAAAAAGDLDEVDRTTTRLARIATIEELQGAVGPWAVASLAAAAHASIALHLLGRGGTSRAISPAVLRGPLRELARHPDRRLDWFDDPSEPVEVPVVLREALLDVPVLGVPGSDFIYPLMQQAEESGLAPRLLAGVAREACAIPAARQDLQRLAAWSMLQEGPEHAPYGWSHCLTLPQAVLGVAARGAAAPHTAIAVAATHVVGFRTALGHCRLDPAWSPPPPATRDLSAALATGPEEAAAFAWAAATSGGTASLIATLAAQASTHTDAHLAKYTVACIEAARVDPEAAPLFLAAAASLRGWWAQHDQG